MSDILACIKTLKNGVQISQHINDDPLHPAPPHPTRCSQKNYNKQNTRARAHTHTHARTHARTHANEEQNKATRNKKQKKQKATGRRSGSIWHIGSDFPQKVKGRLVRLKETFQQLLKGCKREAKKPHQQTKTESCPSVLIFLHVFSYLCLLRFDGVNISLSLRQNTCWKYHPASGRPRG